MQPATTPSPNRIEQRLEGVRSHPTLGAPVRLYIRRREQILYLVVGGWNTVFGYAVWAALQYLLWAYLHYLVIVLIAWPIAVLNAYLGYRYFVFRSHGSVLRELPRFSLVYSLTLIVNLALLPVALSVLPFNIYAIQAMFMVAVIICSYLANKYYSFGAGRRRTRGDAGIHDRGT